MLRVWIEQGGGGIRRAAHRRGERRNVIIERRSADGRRDEMRALAAELAPIRGKRCPPTRRRLAERPDLPTIMKTFSEAIESLVRRGFTEHFGVRGDQLRGFESGKTFGANDVTIREYHRFDGVSDPDDMAILYAIENSSGTRGTLSMPLVFTRIRRSAVEP